MVDINLSLFMKIKDSWHLIDLNIKTLLWEDTYQYVSVHNGKLQYKYLTY